MKSESPSSSCVMMLAPGAKVCVSSRLDKDARWPLLRPRKIGIEPSATSASATAASASVFSPRPMCEPPLKSAPAAALIRLRNFLSWEVTSVCSSARSSVHASAVSCSSSALRCSSFATLPLSSSVQTLL